jgi:hypothetical protein
MSGPEGQADLEDSSDAPKVKSDVEVDQALPLPPPHTVALRMHPLAIFSGAP